MKVYLSSTYRDLQAHRAAVDLILRKMGHDVIGMEQYAAEGNRPVERCKRDVAQSDVYALILEWRYGYIPPDNNPERKSITEIEYRHALAKDKTVLAFVLDPETPWPPNAMDSASADAEAAAAISRLRSEVGSQFLAGIFSTPADLASQVAAAVASHGLTASISELVLNRADVAASAMGGFGLGGILADTSIGVIKEMITQVGRDRALVVRLGEGDTWWSTRLFLLASLLHALTPVRQIVFTGRDGRFAGMASPAAIMDGLAANFAELDDFGRSVRHQSASQDRQRETDRQIELWHSVFSAPPKAIPAQVKSGTRGDTVPEPSHDEQDVQVGVREDLLVGWLGERLISRCIQIAERPSMAQIQQILECLIPDVPLEVSTGSARGANSEAADSASDKTDPTEVLVRVIDRDAFALELAREWVRTGLPRNQAR